MNYIKQLTGFFEMVSKDYRLNPSHISLYMALFQFWNLNRFKNPICINRSELMEISKIGAKATYHKAIKDLHNFKYIRYEPSYNHYRGSHVYMFNYQYSDQSNNMFNKGTGNRAQGDSVQSCDGQEQEPYINNTNLLNIKNNLNLLVSNEQATSSNFEQVDFDEEVCIDGKLKEKEEKSCAKKEEKERGGAKFAGNRKPQISIIDKETPGNNIPPSLEEVKEYFRSESYPDYEANKFFHYFSSNGWMIGGRAPMKNWHSATHNWMLMATKLYSNETHQRNNYSNLSPGHLHDPNDRNKDYSEPL